ncbi:MAG: carbohydrate ABC transporter permease [Eubacteriales bacterium]|nr:carbohydrate ABC transporter permease [Eubacteriales bacterium]
MKKRQREGQIISPAGRAVRWFFSIVLFLYTMITFLVLGATVLDSFKTKSDLIMNMFGWPKQFVLESYQEILLKDQFGQYFMNSLIVTGCGTFCCIMLAAMTAYGISRYEFKGKQAVTMYLLVGMMFPIQVSVLPLFLILKNLHLLNNLAGMIVIYAAGISLPVYVFSRFFHTVPVSLDESARLDGAGEFTIFVKILLPICKPVIFTIALITAIGEWNDFYLPMVMLGKKSVRTLTLAIYKYSTEFLKYMNVSFAAVVITLIPIILMYCLFSRQIVEGLTGGAVKG